MARNPSIGLGVSRLDHSGEIGRFTIPLGAQFADLDVFLADDPWLDFSGSLNAVTDGLTINIGYSVSERFSNAEFATAGQREDKWLCIYQDNTTLAIYNIELPCRKNSLATVSGKDTVDLTVSPWALFKTHFEALVFSPDGNATTLLEVRLVGRNN